MREPSFWEQNYILGSRDLVIIGAGIVGLTAAYTLAEKFPRKRILIVDRANLPYGATTRNAGFTCFGSLTEILETEADLKDKTAVKNILKLRFRGLQALLKNFSAQELGYRATGNFELFSCEQNQDYERALEILPGYNKFLASEFGVQENYQKADSLIETFRFNGIQHIISSAAEGLIDPGKLFEALLKKVTSAGAMYLGNFQVDKVDKTSRGYTLISTSGQTISSEHVLWTTNGFASNLLPDEVIPARAQILVTKPLRSPLPFQGGFHLDTGYFYFRDFEQRVILGGGRNLDFQGETTNQMGTTETIQKSLRTLLRETIIPWAKPEIEMAWSGIMAIGPGKHQPPIVKKLPSGEFVAVRMGTMGIAIGTTIGQQAAQLIAESSFS